MRQNDRDQRGIALVITLGALVLLTVLILAFFTKSLLNRQLAFSGSSQVKVGILARTAFDIVIGELRDEIVGGSTVSNGGDSSYPMIYLPTNNSDTILQKSGVSGEDANGLIVIRKVSRDGAPLNANGGRVLASPVSTSDASLNGRKWTASKWFTGNSSPGLGSATVPDWVLISRQNGIVTSPNIDDAKNSSHADYIVGRFAYVIYDTSGLLDANVAGFASTLSSNTGYKSSPAYANLTALGLGQPAVDRFISWRNRQSNGNLVDQETFDEWASGIERSSGTPDADAMNAVRSGHLSVPLAYEAVLSRQDLLNQPDIGSAASLFTHFSRATAGATVSPATVTTSNPELADVRFTAGATITHYGDDGSKETYNVQAGDPLLLHKFSLARIAWLTPEGPAADLPVSHAQHHAGGTAEAIRSCFGLEWDSSDERWQYVGSDGGAVETQIKDLAAVANESREPNFFELLRAGIIEGSLGQYTRAGAPLSGYGTPNVQPTLEQSKDLQVMRIGANIIDCADTDNYPTLIYFEPAGLGIESAGVENLPYLHGVDTLLLTQTTSSPNEITEADLIWTPILFNPHGTTSASAGGPTQVTAKILRGNVTYIYILGAGQPALERDPVNVNLSGQQFTVSASGFTSRPEAAKNAGNSQSVANLVPYVSTAGDRDILTFRIFSYNHDSPGTLPLPYTSSGFNARVRISDFLMALQYRTPGGVMKNYTTLGGYDNGSGNAPDMGTVYADCNVGRQVDLGVAYFNVLFDPRTIRLGPAQGWIGESTKPGSGYDPFGAYPENPGDLRYRLPTGWGSISARTVIQWPMWPQGNKTDSIPSSGSVPEIPSHYINMEDPDQVTRPADGWLGDDANPYRNFADNSRRPVVLQRPYRTVAELGYVFRDNPWKTLNFFDTTTGDGALLDLFSVSDEPAMRAGYLNVNLSPERVIQALLDGTGQDASGGTPLANPNFIASSYRSFTMDASGAANATMPSNVASFPDFLMSLNGNAGAGLDVIKWHRESLIRSLAGSSQTRTWNLLIDMVAQTGRYPQSASSLDDFLVEGEKRFWLSIAIDRYTGQIVDQHLEPVLK